MTAIAGGNRFSVALIGTGLTPAPIITTQPFSQIVVAGQNATFTVAASGTPAPTYQWRKDGVDLPGATGASYSIASAQPSDTGGYSVVATNTEGTATSLTATLSVAEPLALTTQPQAQTSDTGTFTGTFSVAATGTGPITYRWEVSYDRGNQWQDVVNGARYSGAATATLSVNGLDTTYNLTQFRCVLTNAAGSLTSAAAILTVNPAPAPPTLTTQPESQTVSIGANVSFTVAATSASAMTYQWQKNGSAIAGATGATYSLPSVQPADAGTYSVVVTNSVGPVTSAAATLVVKTPPAITTQPVPQAVVLGQHATFTVAASGTAPFSHQWRKGSVAITAGNASATTATLTLPAVQPGDAGSYDVIVSNSEGFATSLAVTLTVIVAPTITTPPADQTVAVGGGATFTVTAGGTGPFTYQWKRDGITLGGATLATLTLANVQAADAGGYAVDVTNPAGMATSAAATLTVLERPVISSQPAAQAVNVGGPALFSVAASGSRALTYQWRKDGAPLPGATAATLAFTAENPAAAGSYEVVVGLAGTAITTTSSAAPLTVNAAPVFGPDLPGRYAVARGVNLMLNTSPAIGAGATLQWRRNGLPIAGATARALGLVNFGARDAGYYQLVSTENATSATSPAVFLHVSLPAAVFGWGLNAFGQASPPGVLADVVAVAAGYQHSLAVRADGTLVAWGGDGNGPAAVPAGLRNVVAVAAGVTHTLALRADGTVVAWGSPASIQATVPGGLANVVAVAAGSLHSLALKGDGTVVGWGTPGSGQEAIPAGLGGVVAVAAGNEHSLALRADGTVVLWGNSGSGRTALPNGLAGVVAIAAGNEHNLALKGDGTVVAWGSSTFGQSTVPTGLAGVVAVAAGYAHSLALRGDGSLVSWGANDYGQITLPAGLGQVVALGAHLGFHNLALHDATTDALPAIVTPPVGGVVNLGTAFSLGVAGNFGSAPLGYQWRKGGTPIAGATNATLLLYPVALADAGAYSVTVTNYLGTATSATATLTVISDPQAPAITAQPQNVTVNAGTEVTLTVAATGNPVPAYEWRKSQTAIPGASTPALTLPAVTMADGGFYSVVVTNSLGSATSNPAQLKVVPAGTTVAHAVIGGGYTPQGKVTITNTIAYPGAAGALGWQVLLPEGWSFDSDGGSAGEQKPATGTTGALEWAWTTIPPSPVTFTYTLNKPAGAAGEIPLAAFAILRLLELSWSLDVLAKPDPLLLKPVVPHSADVDRNFRVNLTELTRVIELYNTRLGTSRTGRYKVQANTEDGFAPDPEATTNQALATYHAADSSRNGAINLSELTRVIELYNYRAGTTRTGQYRAVPPPAVTEDGFAPGP